MTSCQLYQLQCGKVYSLTVMAEDDACNSTGNISATMMTGREEEKRKQVFVPSENI